jgi:hypothetical protein
LITTFSTFPTLLLRKLVSPENPPRKNQGGQYFIVPKSPKKSLIRTKEKKQWYFQFPTGLHGSWPWVPLINDLVLCPPCVSCWVKLFLFLFFWNKWILLHCEKQNLRYKALSRVSEYQRFSFWQKSQGGMKAGWFISGGKLCHLLPPWLFR